MDRVGDRPFLRAAAMRAGRARKKGWQSPILLYWSLTFPAAKRPEERAVLADDVIVDVLEQLRGVLPFFRGDWLDGAWWDSPLIASHHGNIDVVGGGRGGRGDGGSSGDGSGARSSNYRVVEGYGDGGGGGGIGRGRQARRWCRLGGLVADSAAGGHGDIRRTRLLRQGADPALRAAPVLAARDLHRAAHPLAIIATGFIVKSINRDDGTLVTSGTARLDLGRSNTKGFPYLTRCASLRDIYIYSSM